MLIDSIKNNLNIVLHSTVDFTRSKIEKVAKFIFKSSCHLFRYIRDNPKITLASSFVIASVSISLQSKPLAIMGLVLGVITVSVLILRKSLRQGDLNEIDRLRKEINRITQEIDSEQRGYDSLVNEGGSQEELLHFQLRLISSITRNTAQIAEYERRINRMETPL